MSGGRGLVIEARRHTLVLASLAFLLAWLTLALLTPWISPYGPEEPVAQAGGALVRNLLGVDHGGRDLFSRLLWGARASLGVSLPAAALATALGVLMGGLTGLSHGLTRRVLQGLTDLFLALPLLLVLLVIVGLHGPRANVPALEVVLVLGSLAWMDLAVLVRNRTSELAASGFVLAARVQGLSTAAVLRGHILPHLTGLIGVAACFSMARMVLLESTLAYLGLGVHRCSWGAMVSEASTHLVGPWQIWLPLFHPALQIVLLVSAFSVLGESLRRRIDGQGDGP